MDGIDFVNLFITIFGSGIFVSLFAWLSKNLIITRLTNSVRHEFDEKLEAIKTDNRKSEEAFKAELQSKESQIQALRSGALSGLVSRQAALDKRRLEAVDQLWAAFNTLSAGRWVASFIAVINVDAALRIAANDPKAREMFGTLSQQPNQALDLKNEGWKARPFVSPMAWAIFAAYQAIIGMSHGLLLQLKTGIEGKFFDSEKIIALVKAALPEYVEYINQHKETALLYLLDALETKLLSEFSKCLSSSETDISTMKMANEILRAAAQLNESTVKTST